MECPRCGTQLKLTDGWYPTYNDPDNSGFAPLAEPYCPKCKDEHKDQNDTYHKSKGLMI